MINRFSMASTIFAVFALSCSSTMSSSDGGSADAGATADAGTGCPLTENTTATTTVNPAGCAALSRDTSTCQASRQAAGLSGYWLKFSCRVTLSKTTVAGAEVVQAQADGQPDYKSNYFATTHPCYEAYTGAIQNPNRIAAKSYAIDFPTAPNMTPQAMTGAVVG